MRRSTLLSLTLLLAASPAFADTFNFTFTGSPASGYGQFTAAPLPAGTYSIPAYLITAVTGSATYNNLNTPITGIAPQAAGGDNVLFFPGTGVGNGDFFDGNGVAFNLGNGVIVDLYAYSGITLTVPGVGPQREIGSINVTQTPEPATLTLLATGCLTLALRARRRL